MSDFKQAPNELGRSSYGRAYMAAAAITVVGIATSLWAFYADASWAPLPFVVAVLAAFATVGIFGYRSEETAESFFFYTRRMPPTLFKWTYVTANVGLFSSIFYSTFIAYALGPAGMVYPLVAWLLGMYWFSRNIPRLLPFFKEGASIHDFIACRYGHTERSRLVLRRITSSVTITLLWCSIAIEVKFGADIAAGMFGWASAFSAAAAIAVIGTIYTYFAGYRGATRTDFVQGLMMGLGAICLIGYSVYLMVARPVAFNENYTTLKGVFLGPTPLILPGIVVLMLLYQFCVMDMWQRCIAAAESFSDEPEEQQIARLKKATFSGAIPLFLLMFFAWYIVGLAAAATGLTDDPTAVLPALLTSLSSGGWAPFVLLLVIIGAFAGAIISTFDTYLMALTQAFMYDWYGPSRPHLRGVAKNSRNAPEAESKRFVNASRFWLAIFGISAIVVAAFQLRLLDFWVGMYSLMLALFPAVFFGIRRGPVSVRDAVSSRAAIISIVAGFLTSLTFGILGTFTTLTLGSLAFSDVGPIATLTVAFAGLAVGGIGRRRKTDA